MGTVSESFAIRIEVVLAYSGHRGILVDDRCGFTADAVPFAKRCDVGTCFDDTSCELMPEGDRIVHWPAMKSCPLVQVATAHADGCDFHERIARADIGNIDFTKFHGHRFLGKIHNSRLLVHSDLLTNTIRIKKKEFYRLNAWI